MLYSQFWEFGPDSPEKWLLSLNYWPNDLFLFKMVVWLVLLELSSVLGGMSSHLYHSFMSPDHPKRSVFPSSHPGQSYGDFISFQRLYQQKWTRNLTEKIDLASTVKEMAWNFGRLCVSTPRTVLQQLSRLFYFGSSNEESPPMGAPSTWPMMYFIVISYDLKL